MDLRAQVILHTTDSLAANYVTNSWAMTTGAGTPDDGDLQDYTVCFKDFYDDLNGILALPLAQNNHQVKWYDLNNPVPPSYPLYEGTFNLAAAPSGAGLPSEVAVCLSMQGLKASGSPQNRRRGRVYIGPITSSINSTGRPSSAARGQLASSAQTLISNLKAAGVPAQLGIWSQVESHLVVVDNGWIDDTFDTQRRRGLQPTGRTTWDAP